MLLPRSVLRTMIVLVSLSEAARLLAGRGETANFATLVNGVGNPVDAGITTDSLVGGVDEDDFVILVHSVLIDPVGLKTLCHQQRCINGVKR